MDIEVIIAMWKAGYMKGYFKRQWYHIDMSCLFDSEIQAFHDGESHGIIHRNMGIDPMRLIQEW